MLVYIPLQGHYQEAVPGITMDMRSTEWGVEHSMLHHQGHTIVKVKFVFYNGDGYTTYSTKASPNMTQYNSISTSASHLQTNQTGLTYGSALFSETEPDLILAEGISGNIGYVKSSDLNGPMPVSAYAAIQIANFSISSNSPFTKATALL